MNKELESKAKEHIDKILQEGINTNNLDNLYKLVDIYKDAKEVDSMNYGNYGGRPIYDSYGRDNYRGYNDYGRRGYDMKYRGEEHIDRMANDYGRYMESRDRYGANEETNKSYEYMLKSLEDFIRVLHEEASTPQQHQMLNETLQRSMR